MSERDKFLTEIMGECWHDMQKDPGSESWDEKSANNICSFQCSKCLHYEEDVQYSEYPRDNPRGWLFDDYNNFSTWEGFGKLWEWSQKQEWWTAKSPFWAGYTAYKNQGRFKIGDAFINPDRFADAVFSYLKERDK